MKKAFTLIEILISLALTAVLVGMGASISYKSTQRQQVDQAGLNVQSVLETARANALNGKKLNCLSPAKLGGWGVFFDTTDNDLDLIEYCAPLPTCPTSANGTTSFKVSSTKLSTNSSITMTALPAPNPIVYQPLGLNPYKFTGCPKAFLNFASLAISGNGFVKQVDISPQGRVTAAAIITATPGPIPTAAPTAVPTAVPTAAPTAVPTAVPTAIPTIVPGTPPSYVARYLGGTNASNQIAITVSTAGSNTLYLAAVATRNGVIVNNITGLGLTWSPVTSQCSAAGETIITVYKAYGSGSTGTLFANLSGSTAGYLTVALFANTNPSNPIGNIVKGNTLGVSGACSGGTNTASFSFNLSTGGNSIIFGAESNSAQGFSVGSGYTLIGNGATGTVPNQIRLGNEYKYVSTPGTVVVNGTLNSAIDWAAIGVEIN